MQCGIPVLRIECPEAQIFASTPNNKSVWKVCYIIKQILTKQTELSFMIALFVDMSIPGAIHSIIQ